MNSSQRKPAYLLWMIGYGFGCVFAGLAHAHEGHDHTSDHDEDARPIAAPAPIGTVSTPQVEMVVARERKDIVIYIDDYASNAPIDGLQVKIRSGSQLLQASASGDGIYRVPADLLEKSDSSDKSGESQATFLIYGKNLDLNLQSSIPAEPPVSATQPAASHETIELLAVLAGVLLIAAAGWLKIRRRYQRPA